MIEIVIQAENLTDSRGGGLIRLLKFGTIEDIYREKQFSMAAQQLTAAAMVIQATYLLVFFIILVLFCCGVANQLMKCLQNTFTLH